MGWLPAVVTAAAVVAAGVAPSILPVEAPKSVLVVTGAVVPIRERRAERRGVMEVLAARALKTLDEMAGVVGSVVAVGCVVAPPVEVPPRPKRGAEAVLVVVPKRFVLGCDCCPVPKEKIGACAWPLDSKSVPDAGAPEVAPKREVDMAAVPKRLAWVVDGA